MAVPDMRDDSWIGRRVGGFRRTHGWTLATLADKVGLSSTQLSRIESGTRQPSVGTLIELARVFGVSLSELVEDQEVDRYHLSRANDRRPRETANGTLTTLSGGFPGLQAVHLAIPVEADAPVAQHQGEEWLYVLCGTVDVQIGDDTATLAAGDAAHFPSRTAHRVSNPRGNEPAQVLLVSTSTTANHPRASQPRG